jgi:hypothetical protein
MFSVHCAKARTARASGPTTDAAEESEIFAPIQLLPNVLLFKGVGQELQAHMIKHHRLNATYAIEAGFRVLLRLISSQFPGRHG